MSEETKKINKKVDLSYEDENEKKEKEKLSLELINNSNEKKIQSKKHELKFVK